ncbi:MAG TPA: outer membrane porin GjpA [Mycobacterium sp.]|nr:outer membrane porin GjpA [Mycobacterium sp.]HUH70070.1 outer membrane porin GjpA [Mycobacterium sp.]
MSFVIATPELVHGAAQDLAGIRSSLAEATAAASGPTTGIAAAAEDEVSIAIASLFGDVGQQFQALSAQAQAFHAQFVDAMNASAGAYASTEVANAIPGGGVLGNIGQSFGASTRAIAGSGDGAPTLAQGLNGFGATVAAPYQALVKTSVANAQTLWGASGQALGDLGTGVVTNLGLLVTNPAAALHNLGAAVQSVALIGNPDDPNFVNLVQNGGNGYLTGFAQTVVQHTTDVQATATPGNGEEFPGQYVHINSIHYQIWAGLNGSGFEPGAVLPGPAVQVVASLAASPLSGVLIGFAGPVVSPGVALMNETGAIVDNLTGANPNPVAALATVLDTPATVTNAFLNGATLNLDPLIPIVNPFVSAGDSGGQNLTALSIAFGGLLSPGETTYGPFGTGGSFINSLGMGFDFSPPDGDAGATLSFQGAPVGPIGATENLVDIFGQLLQGNLTNSDWPAGYGPV